MRTVLAILALLALTATAHTATWSWLDQRIPDYGREPIRPGKSVRLGGYFYGGVGRGSEEIAEWLPKGDIAKAGGAWLAERDWIGRHLDLYSAGVGAVAAEDFPALRRQNPAMCLLLMWCPVICAVGEGKGLTVGGLDPDRMADWRLMTTDGQEAPNPLWGTKELGRLTWLMDIGHPGWAAHFKERALALTRQYGADGYCIDGVPWHGCYYLSDKVMLARYTTPDQVDAAIYRFLDIVRAGRPCLVVDDVTSEEQQAHLDGIWGEDWLAYDATLPWGEDKVERWELAVSLVERYSAQRKPYLAAGWYHYGKPAELEYLLATYLLAKQSGSVVFQPQPMGSGRVGPPRHGYDLGGYHLGLVMQEIARHRALFDVELGRPLGKRTPCPTAPGVWQRRFEKGLVLVNPSVTESAKVPLPRLMQQVGGGKTDLLALPPRSGAILLRS